jgi:hypothetical protein
MDELEAKPGPTPTPAVCGDVMRRIERELDLEESRLDSWAAAP